MKVFRFGLILAFGVLSSLFAASALAQCYIWNGDKWPGTSVTYCINSDLATNDASEEDWTDAINSAATQWNAAGADFQFDQGSDVSYDPGTEPPGVYQLGWYAQSGTDTTAITNVTDDPNNSAAITQVETYFNQAYDYSANPNSSQLDIWTEAVHELGHWLNLQSETDPSCSDNVMYEYKSEGDISHRYLTDDDKAGIVFIYGGLVGIGYTPPPAPTNFSVSIVGQNAVLNWLEPSGGCTPSFMIVYKNGNVIANPGPSSTSYTDANATSSLPATYVVGAYVEGSGGQGCGGESDSPSISVTAAPSTVSSNTTWSGVVYVNNSVTVNSGCTLTISPGTSVYFSSGNSYSLTANGQLNVEGGTFTSNSSSPSPGNWGSIVLSGSGANYSSINNASIEYGTGIQANNTSNVTISHCNIINCSSYGIDSYFSSNLVARSNTIANTNIYHGIFVTGGQATIAMTMLSTSRMASTPTVPGYCIPVLMEI
ncbi:MAG: right-handed parallel beta-helix repeat-containing protein [Bacteroidetes bacterium]|nr:right-handed parallel beta-helix repeat-containing protein [Bacteroidota bacterium]